MADGEQAGVDRPAPLRRCRHDCDHINAVHVRHFTDPDGPACFRHQNDPIETLVGLMSVRPSMASIRAAADSSVVNVSLGRISTGQSAGAVVPISADIIDRPANARAAAMARVPEPPRPQGPKAPRPPNMVIRVLVQWLVQNSVQRSGVVQDCTVQLRPGGTTPEQSERYAPRPCPGRSTSTVPRAKSPRTSGAGRSGPSTGGRSASSTVTTTAADANPHTRHRHRGPTGRWGRDDRHVVNGQHRFSDSGTSPM